MAISTGANVPNISEGDIEAARRAYIAKTGRPSIYSTTIAAELLERLERGETLTSICKDKHMPGETTVLCWKREIETFGRSYIRARQQAAALKIDRGHDKIDALEAVEYELDDQGEPLIDEKGNKIKVKLSMSKIRLAEIQFKSALDVAKCYDRDQFGPSVQVQQSITIETMEQRVQRLTGEPILISVGAECLIEE